MAKLLYSFYFKSERAFLCKQGHAHRVDNYEVACEDDESELLLAEFPDSLSEVPWVKVGPGEWSKGKPKITSRKPQLEEGNNGTC